MVNLSLAPFLALLCSSAVTARPQDGTHASGQVPELRLVVQITVDQLRGDLPARYLDRMPEGGFRRLLGDGLWYGNAHHQHANTETIVGHATLATGAYPAVHGMVGNVWFDRATGQPTYNIEDARYHLLTRGADVDADQEIDPTQRAARSEGRSPAAILSSTFSDELKIHSAGRAKVFGVSVKDRGAVSMAGHAGQAYWFSKAAGRFVTSDYYREAYPEWVEAWHADDPPGRYAGSTWSLHGPEADYLFVGRDDQEWETALPGWGRTFPHAYGEREGAGYNTFLTLSPAGDELVADFGLELLRAEQLGQDDVVDYLSFSFSSTDYVGHVFGPSSLESEDNLLRLDRTLARVLEEVDDTVGLEHTVVVLCADHGGPEAPEDLRQYGLEVDFVAPGDWDTSAGFSALKRRFGIDQALIQGFQHPYVYLDREVIAAEGLDQAEVERAVAEQLTLLPGVHAAYSSSALMSGALPDTRLVRSVLNNHHPRRSGDVFVVFQPNWFLNDFDGLVVASTHGSPWTYDTFVPLVFLGHGIPAGRVHREVHTIDVAPTLSALVGIKPPSGSEGQVLVETLAR